MSFERKETVNNTFPEDPSCTKTVNNTFPEDPGCTKTVNNTLPGLSGSLYQLVS